MTKDTEQGSDAPDEPSNGAGQELSPARGLAIDTLGYLPRLVAGALEDLRTIAESVRVLPGVARSLTAIEASVDSMDREVRLMRQGVDNLGDGVDRLDGDLVKVVEGVAPLDSKLEDLRRTLHPLSRATSLLGRRREREVEGPVEDPERG
jgi:hypothetical protein